MKEIILRMNSTVKKLFRNNLFIASLISKLYPNADRRRLHGVEHGPTVHILPAGRPQEQPSVRGTPADAPVRNEPHVRAAGRRRYPRQPDVHPLR